MTGFCLLVLLGLTASGCVQSVRTPPATGSVSISPRAETTYNYLVYQDLAGRLNKALQVPGTMTQEQIDDLRLRTIEALDRVMADAPSAQLYRDKAALYWTEAQYGRKSREILTEGLKKYPGDRIMTMYLANSWLMEGKTARAASIMNDYLGEHPDDMEARERYGQMLVEAGNYADGLDQLNTIPESKSTAETYYYRSRALGKLGDREKAIDNLKKAIKRYPDFVEGLAELAYQYELTRQYTLAEKTYERLLEVDGGPEVRLRLVDINVKLNNLDKALSLAMEGPKTKSFLLDAVNSFMAEGFYAQASTMLDVLAGRKPIPAEYWFYKAVIANEGEADPAKALGFLEKVAPDNKHYPRALQFRAQLLNLMGRKQEAENAIAEGLKKFPDQNRFYILKASLLASRGDKSEALDVLESGLKKRPGDAELMYELGMLLDGMDRRPQAMEIMEKLLVKHPDHPEALNFVGYSLAEQGRDLDRALVLVNNAARLDPGNGYIVDSLAWVHYKRKDYEKAWQTIREAVTIEDHDPTIWEHYGDIARAVGNIKQARKGYENALKHGGDPEKLNRKLKAL
jgi:tetratricopeptide (TPR) repeat protein